MSKKTARRAARESDGRRAGPTRAELLAAADRTVRDVVGSGLRVLFSGINPGLYTAWTGHHFARPGNRFWPALHGAGFTPRLFAPREERLLLGLGYGITNVVPRATATAGEVTAPELAAGGRRLRRLVSRHHPQCVAVLGVGAYRAAFGDRDAAVGRQSERWGNTVVWVLPNPSGLNAHYQLAELVRLFGELKAAIGD